MIRAICINDKNQPLEVHPDEWIKKGEQYTIVHVYFHPNQSVQGVELKEVKLTKRSRPYETFNLKRFAIPLSELDSFSELLYNCTELNDVDLDELLEGIDIIKEDGCFSNESVA